MKSIVVFIIVLLCSSCQFFGTNTKLVAGNYQVICGYSEDNYLTQKKKNPQSVNSESRCNQPGYHRSFLSLKENKQFVFALDDVLLHGSYQIAGDELLLENENAEIFKLKIIQSNKDFIQLQGNFSSFNSKKLPNSETLYLNFELDKAALRETPTKYDLAINTWRNAPKQSENEQMVKQRTLNYLDYTIAYFQHITDSGLTTGFNLNGIESPITYVRNGIALKKWEDVPSDWKTLFYDEQNAKQGYDYLVAGFQTGKREKYNLEGSLLITYYLKDLRNTLIAL